MQSQPDAGRAVREGRLPVPAGAVHGGGDALLNAEVPGLLALDRAEVISEKGGSTRRASAFYVQT